MDKKINKTGHQSGATTVEFAIVGSVFFMLLFGAIEVGRIMYTWNTLTEATRIGSRTAAVCGVQDSVINSITRLDPDNTGSSFFPSDFVNENIEVNYLTENGGVINSPSGDDFLLIRFVQVRIVNYQYDFIFPGIGTITLPPFSTTRPREALGIVPNEGTGIC